MRPDEKLRTRAGSRTTEVRHAPRNNAGKTRLARGELLKTFIFTARRERVCFGPDSFRYCSTSGKNPALSSWDVVATPIPSARRGLRVLVDAAGVGRYGARSTVNAPLPPLNPDLLRECVRALQEILVRGLHGGPPAGSSGGLSGSGSSHSSCHEDEEQKRFPRDCFPAVVVVVVSSAQLLANELGKLEEQFRAVSSRTSSGEDVLLEIMLTKTNNNLQAHAALSTRLHQGSNNKPSQKISEAAAADREMLRGLDKPGFRTCLVTNDCLADRVDSEDLRQSISERRVRFDFTWCT